MPQRPRSRGHRAKGAGLEVQGGHDHARDSTRRRVRSLFRALASLICWGIGAKTPGPMPIMRLARGGLSTVFMRTAGPEDMTRPWSGAPPAEGYPRFLRSN